MEIHKVSKSAIYLRTEKKIRDTFGTLEKNNITPWAFFNLGKPFQVKKFDGSKITSEGFEFSGSIRQIYWHSIEPFIEDITVKVIDEVVTLTQEKSQDLKETLTEAEGLLVSYTRKTYQRMAEIDQRLRGKGYPKNVNIQKTDRYETPMIEFIKGSVSDELKTYRPKSRFEQFYQNNKFLVWLVGILGAVIKFSLGKSA
jgi:hypothetical protein